jgi:low affinity Fe/Cu permease
MENITDPLLELVKQEDFKRFCFKVLDYLDQTKNELIGIESNQIERIESAIESNDTAIFEIDSMIDRINEGLK